MTIKDSKYVNICSINILYFLFDHKVNKYFEEINGNKHLTLVLTNESKENKEKYEELWSKIFKDLIRLITNNWDDYDEKNMKIKFNSDDKLPLNKMIEIPTIMDKIYETNCSFEVKLGNKGELKFLFVSSFLLVSKKLLV